MYEAIMSERKKLIEVHSETDQLQHCSCCDGPTIQTKLFYKELETDSHFGFQTYLDCCKDQVGDIVDWYSFEDYKKVTKKENFHGIVLTHIAGYKRS